MAGTFHYQPNELQENLKMIVDQILQPGKGIYSADENSDSMEEKLGSMCLSTNSKDIKKEYTKLRFSLVSCLTEYISTMVISEEDLDGKVDDCTKIIDVLKENNMVIGVNVTTGNEIISQLGFENEEVPQGLDGLFEKCGEFRKTGVSLLKWRVVLRMGPNTPSDVVIVDNANSAARFAAICQANGLVPLIEIELPTKGSHCIYKTQRTTERVLNCFSKHLIDHNVFLEGVILSPSFAVPGSESSMFCDAATIAGSTVTAFRRSVPGAIAGVAMLSSGLPLQEAVGDLRGIIINKECKPWPITFNFGSTHPDQVLAIWEGKPDRVKDAQSFLLRILADASKALVVCEC